MSRVTIEDSLSKFPDNNQFSLVISASMRARQLMNGHEPRISVQRDKPPVIALREIANNILPQKEEEIDSLDEDWS